MSAPKIDQIYFHCMDLTVTVVFKEKKCVCGGGGGVISVILHIPLIELNLYRLHFKQVYKLFQQSRMDNTKIYRFNKI